MDPVQAATCLTAAKRYCRSSLYQLIAVGDEHVSFVFAYTL